CIIANIALGPLSGVVATTIKELVHLMLHGASSTGGIGNLADYVTCLCVIIPSGFIYKFKPNMLGLSIGLAVGSVCSAILSGLVFNAIAVYPLYDKFILPMTAILSMYQAIRPSANGLWEVLAIFNVPFTFLKCVIISILAVIIAKPLNKYLIKKPTQNVPE
ncbi:MAG: ECF transporter S component, partial [Clostridia bacterium]|nr:ECF transporter S component [Clostridia bacterium]